MNFGFYQKQKRGYEDRYVIENLPDLPDYYFLAVFDGHGRPCEGIHVVDFCKDNFVKYLNNGLKGVNLQNKEEVISKITETFVLFDTEMKKEDLEGGCTCSAVLIDTIKNVIYQINLGDSRSIIFDNEKVISTSADHKPTTTSEKVRIFQSGHYVQAGRVDGLLAVSRAFGDFDPVFKNFEDKYDPIKSAVSAVPDVVAMEMGNTIYNIIITSDAPFERSFYDNIKLIELSKCCKELENNCSFIAKRMVEIIDKTTTDDITIIYFERY